MRKHLWEATLPVDFAALDVDLDRLRRGFAALFDDAARAVQLAGYQQDDTVLERLLLCRIGEKVERMITVDCLSDRSRFLDHIRAQALGPADAPSRLRAVRIVGLKVVSVLDILPTRRA